MGDKDRSMGEEQEEEMNMVLHCPPVYPLPEEIKKSGDAGCVREGPVVLASLAPWLGGKVKTMEHSETVCRYCGVSYLIFHEFHQLHSQLALQEAELQELRETVQREKAQREALELGRLEWERGLRMDLQRQAEAKEKNIRDELEEKTRALRDEFEKTERKRKEVEEKYEKISEDKERELRSMEVESLKKQREELERRAKEREKVLTGALQMANKNLDEQRKYLQQLEERLAVATSTQEETERLLGKETQQGEILRGVCMQQQQTLRLTLSTLRSTGSDLFIVQGFLSQLTGAWQAFRSQILLHSTQVFTVLIEEVKHSREDFQKMRKEKEHLSQQLMEQRRQSEEQLSQLQSSEKEHKNTILRLKGELVETREEWLSCQRKCDTIQEQLLLWQQREEQMNRKCCTAEEEVYRLGIALGKVQQETREQRREREMLIESHGRALSKVEEDSRQQMASKLAAALEEQRTQNALHLREQMVECRREVELELMIDREKNQLLLLQYQRGSTRLQQKLEEREQELKGLQEELQQERRNREEERRRRKEEMLQEQQEALQLSQAKAELQLMTERNAELQEEVALLQETVRRECEEREELTAALCKAQDELIGPRSMASHQGSSQSPPCSTERHTLPGDKHSYCRSPARVALSRSSVSPNTLRTFSACTDKDGDRGADGGGAEGSLDSWTCSGMSGGVKKQEGMLPRLNMSSSVNDVKRKVILMMGRKSPK
uniref:trichohyalin isoform X2 n=1 Tax=Monopterus albus TaxID=43700 RepID=UPI0009B46368|nr:leucine-, glutamate- and lysine-rich protein 1 isoform X2 [Monopterus albus]